MATLHHLGMFVKSQSYINDYLKLGLSALEQRRNVFDILFYKALRGRGSDVDISKIGQYVPNINTRSPDYLKHKDHYYLYPIERCVNRLNDISRKGGFNLFNI